MYCKTLHCLVKARKQPRLSYNQPERTRDKLSYSYWLFDIWKFECRKIRDFKTSFSLLRICWLTQVLFTYDLYLLRRGNISFRPLAFPVFDLVHLQFTLFHADDKENRCYPNCLLPMYPWYQYINFLCKCTMLALKQPIKKILVLFYSTLWGRCGGQTLTFLSPLDRICKNCFTDSWVFDNFFAALSDSRACGFVI